MNVLEKILEEILQYRKDNNLCAGKQVVEIERIIRSHMDDDSDGWIPCSERLPEDDSYILLSFENFSLPLVGRYEESEKGGAFYLGDCDGEDTCVVNDVFVNAWQPLPQPYKPKETPAAGMEHIMSRFTRVE